jgi:hypothetical protein
MELNNDELLIRRKRVDEYGDWEYECRSCELWLPKSKFRGCVDFIDAYGNCLMCYSCKSKRAQTKQKENANAQVKLFMKAIGYDVDSDVPIFKQFHQKYNLRLKKRDM